jgi:hypothetical protein
MLSMTLEEAYSMKKVSAAKSDKDFAEIAGVSVKKIRQAKKVQAADPELAKEVIAGRVTLDQAVRRLPSKKERDEQARAKAGFPTYKLRRDDVLALVTRKKGVSLEELMEKFGWQAHSARGFMSRMKDEFMKLESFKTEDGARTYRLAAK